MAVIERGCIIVEQDGADLISDSPISNSMDILLGLKKSAAWCLYLFISYLKTKQKTTKETSFKPLLRGQCECIVCERTTEVRTTTTKSVAW